MTRQSMNMLTGDENDLLAESPLFERAAAGDAGLAHPKQRPAANKEQQPAKQAVVAPVDNSQDNDPSNVYDESNIDAEEFEELDEQLITEIEEYLKGVMETDDPTIDMSDSPIGSAGAKCVAAALPFCESLQNLKLNACSIKDSGARAILEELHKSTTVVSVDLSDNPLTESCFDSVARLLNTNKNIKELCLKNTKASESNLLKHGNFNNRLVI